MILSRNTSYLIPVGLLVLIILIYGNYAHNQASKASGEGSTDVETLDDLTVPDNIPSSQMNENTPNSQKDFLFSDKFEVISETSENDAVFMEGFNGKIKIIQFGPTVNDPNLDIDTVFKGINFPTSMVFLGNNDILVLEKNTGKVKRIINGTMLDQPLLDVHVGNKG